MAAGPIFDPTRTSFLVAPPRTNACSRAVSFEACNDEAEKFHTEVGNSDDAEEYAKAGCFSNTRFSGSKGYESGPFSIIELLSVRSERQCGVVREYVDLFTF